MPDDAQVLRAPALRISHIVCGRENVGGRVRYFVDPEGIRPERAIPEDVVLRRWRVLFDPGNSHFNILEKGKQNSFNLNRVYKETKK